MLSLFAFTLTSLASAQASTRTLKLYFTHTKERAEITFKRNGRYDKEGLRQLNTFLRDWRRNEPTKMNPALFDLIWEVYQKTGSSEYIHVVSAYRSLKTNNMLRSRSKGVAKNSQHTRGNAMDFFIPGVSTAKLRALGLREHVGGVGYYPRSNTPFVHMDTGTVRHWPRMTRSQLAKVFPKGKTIHVPTDGKRMKGYQQALAEIKARKSGRSTSVASRASNSSKPGDRVKGTSSNSGGFFSRLFSSSEEDDSTPPPAAIKPSRRVKEPDPSQRVEAGPQFNAIPQPKIALAASQPASSPVPEAASPVTLAATPFAKPLLESESTPAQPTPTVLALVPPRAKPQTSVQVAAVLPAATLPAATPQPRRTAPTLPAAVPTPQDGVAAIAAATGERTPDSLRPLIGSQLAYASPTQTPALAGDKFSKQTALSTQALFAQQRLPDLTPKQPLQQSIAAQTRYPNHTATLVAAPQASSLLLLDATPTAENRETIRMQHPDQVRIQSLYAAAQSMLRQPFTKRPYVPARARINRGSAIAWLETINTSGLIPR